MGCSILSQQEVRLVANDHGSLRMASLELCIDALARIGSTARFRNFRWRADANDGAECSGVC
jgi:hypothetical protein